MRLPVDSQRRGPQPQQTLAGGGPALGDTVLAVVLEAVVLEAVVLEARVPDLIEAKLVAGRLYSQEQRGGGIGVGVARQRTAVEGGAGASGRLVLLSRGDGGVVGPLALLHLRARNPSQGSEVLVRSWDAAARGGPIRASSRSGRTEPQVGSRCVLSSGEGVAAGA